MSERFQKVILNPEFLAHDWRLRRALKRFNRMATQLENYDEANIEELKSQIKQQSLIATMADGAILLDSKA